MTLRPSDIGKFCKLPSCGTFFIVPKKYPKEPDYCSRACSNLARIRSGECSFDECTQSAATKDGGRRGMCAVHYHQWRADNGAACKYDGCTRPRRVQGYCETHFAQVSENPCSIPGCTKIAQRGTLCGPCREARRIKNAPPCSVRDCDARALARNLCNSHYRRYLEYGDPLGGGPFKGSDNIGLMGAHSRVSALWGKASQYPCVQCGEPAKDWAYDGTDPAEKYGPQARRGKEYWSFYSICPEFYMPMCRPCHRSRDGARAQRELREYRQWKNGTGLSIDDLTVVRAMHSGVA